MKAAGCVIVGLLGLLGGFGCGSDSGDAGSATGTGGMAGAAGAAGGTAGTPVGTSGGAGAAGTTVAGAAAGSSGASPAGRSGGSAGAGTGAVAPSAGAGAGAGGAPAAGSGGQSGAGTGGSAGAAPATTEKFSFFVTSLAGMRMLSKNEQGFGGDLRYGESTGIAGADKICTELAEKAMPGAGAKGWRAFLSTAKGGMGDGPIHARDRVGQGPWYDRNGRLVAMTLEDLLQQRPRGADPAIINDLPNENGVPNRLDTVEGEDDNHDTVTGSNAMGMYDNTPTCNDWTSTETPGAMGAAGSTGAAGRGGGRGGMGRANGPRIGHSWPAQSGMHWIAAHQAPGCAPSVSLVQMGGGSGTGIGNGGGYGGIYCLALKP